VVDLSERRRDRLGGWGFGCGCVVSGESLLVLFVFAAGEEDVDPMR
jgi:hypothetical protein